MKERILEEFCIHTHENRDTVYALLRRFFAKERAFLLRSDLQEEFITMCHEHNQTDLLDSELGNFVRRLQEGIFHAPWAYFALRPGAAQIIYIRIHCDLLLPEQIDNSEFLSFKEKLSGHLDGSVLEIDLGPFVRGLPTLKEPRSIGQGMIFLNRQLSGAMFNQRRAGEQKLLRFLHVHAIDGQPLMLNKEFNQTDVRLALRSALSELTKIEESTSWASFSEKMGKLGFAPGWGNTAGRVIETMNLLLDILEAPSPTTLEIFLARIPMISRLLILSPHGYFGQDNVLGLPDTGGQVIYILDQVRALEREMRERLACQGVLVEPRIVIATRLIPDAGETTCDQHLEKVNGCENTWILRVPFHEEDGSVVRHWISRFEIWPYLERFALDLEPEAINELGGRPDLIIGNYSDGNLVASLLSQRLGVTQCNIAHALEKTKYLHADLYWQENDAQYHFSCQFTADLIAMNTADFVIASTYQEIAGTEESVGQYESYASFTMPKLYRVVNGINLFDPKFNIVSPGADADIFFPYHQSEHRLHSLIPDIESMIYGKDTGFRARGTLADKNKPLIFTMARMDRIKNITGLTEWYGATQQLRKHANLLVIGGYIDPETSADREEREQIHQMHEIMDRYELEGQVRWLGMRLDKNQAGELYRYVADGQGVFVQPALFEAFGLTIIEAMASGLPTFATCYGGPMEIIEHDRSGFHIDPNDGVAAVELIADFFERCRTDPEEWRRLSQGAITRVEARYTWKHYAKQMMTLSRIYGFWKFINGLEREESERYLDMFYQLQFRPLAAAIQRN